MRFLKADLFIAAVAFAICCYGFGPGSSVSMDSSESIIGGQAPVFVPKIFVGCTASLGNVDSHPCGGTINCNSAAVNTFDWSLFGSEDIVTAPNTGCAGIFDGAIACTGPAGESVSYGCAINF